MPRCPRRIRLWTVFLLLVGATVANAMPAFAGLAPSQPSGETSITSARDADVIAVQRALEHKVVGQKLRDYGLSPDQVRARLATMSDQDLHQLASATKGLPSGGDGIDALIGLLIVVLLVIIILKLMNKEIVVR